ncbi:TetR/AcrR family transcriptional regulator [Oceanibacterium hippocampi]|uniref:HTH-type transcriptional repressor ComR n=1 Tax=Oceanibacterium hippocampi TaxID=745714 RepID=A0A1Y5S268_9PROT|nr:TetR/AcrR family transcriptional regulator [Oceanibacterium hippocampi]SLN28285.1 HTH-type transcriptional repressor ComR [Oceanibacterium hippocampi]
MARPRKYDDADVLDRAVEVFWLKGFAATSIQDLVEATGLNRGSLYNAYGDKAGLFAAAIERYGSLSPLRAMVKHQNDAPPRQSIERLFRDLVAIAGADRAHRGCLLTNTATELCALDRDMQQRIAENFGDAEDALCRLVERGQAAGVIAAGRPPRALARGLLATMQGLWVMSKVDPEPERLRDIADAGLAMLDAPPCRRVAAPDERMEEERIS